MSFNNAEVAKALESATVAMYNAQHDLFRILDGISLSRDDVNAWLTKSKQQIAILWDYFMKMPRAYYLVAGTPFYRELRKAIKRVIRCIKIQINSYLFDVQKDSFLEHTYDFLRGMSACMEMEEVTQEKGEYKSYKGIVDKFAPQQHTPMARAFMRGIGRKAREDNSRIELEQEHDRNGDGVDTGES
jgi:hypothetical protein